MNSKTLLAFPSQELIAEQLNTSVKTVRKCIDNLVNAGLIKKLKKGRGYQYLFNKESAFEEFGDKFLYNKKISFDEKAYLASLQQFFFKDGFTGEGKISYTNKELSKIIRLSESTISRHNSSLQEKGILKDKSKKLKRFDLREIDQLFICALRNLDERVTKLENIIIDNQFIL